MRSPSAFFLQAALETIEGAVVKGRKLEIMVYGSGLLSNDALDERCILYVSQSEKARQRPILSALRNKPVYVRGHFRIPEKGSVPDIFPDIFSSPA